MDAAGRRRHDQAPALLAPQPRAGTAASARSRHRGSLHRHTGEVHGYNLEGHRNLLDTGEVIGPGGYVYEPAGNMDSWMAVGDTPLTVFVTVRGAVETLDEAGEVIQRDDTESIGDAYRSYCEANNLEVVDLWQ